MLTSNLVPFFFQTIINIVLCVIIIFNSTYDLITHPFIKPPSHSSIVLSGVEDKKALLVKAVREKLRIVGGAVGMFALK